ncbi:MAG: Maf family protein [Oscillospiraceae bacterium]
MRIILASKSPRRRELFSLITESFECAVSDVDESSLGCLLADELCSSLASLKAHSIFVKNKDCCVVGCDTVVEKDGVVLGKPKNKAEARKMLLSLSGSAHSVYTGVCVAAPSFEKTVICRTNVEFFDIPASDIEAYIDSAGPYDKAGGYGIQDFAARYLNRLDGDYFNVMGLPVSRIYAILLQNNFI